MDVYKEWLGIPEGPRPPNHYELLRCKKFEDDTDRIRGNYKKLNAHVRKYATGQYSIQSQDLLNEIAKAMLCLTDAERKRDYDESLGREFPAERDSLGRQPLLDILIRQNAIARSQKSEIEEFADRRGLSHRDAVVQMKLVEPEPAAQALAQNLGYSYVDLEDMLPEDAMLDLSPRSLVKKYSFVPLFIDDDRLLAACIDEVDHELEEELRLRYGVPVRPVIASPRAINQAIAKYYAPGVRDETVAAAALANAQAARKSAAKAATTKGGARQDSSAKPSGKAAEKDRAAAKPAPAIRPNVPFAQLSAEEQALKKQYGLLMICAGVFLPMSPKLVGTFAPSLAVEYAFFGSNLWFYAAVLLGGGAAAYVMRVYWK